MKQNSTDDDDDKREREKKCRQCGYHRIRLNGACMVMAQVNETTLENKTKQSIVLVFFLFDLMKLNDDDDTGKWPFYPTKKNRVKCCFIPNKKKTFKTVKTFSKVSLFCQFSLNVWKNSFFFKKKLENEEENI